MDAGETSNNHFSLNPATQQVPPILQFMHHSETRDILGLGWIEGGPTSIPFLLLKTIFSFPLPIKSFSI